MAPERTRASVISSACSPRVGLRNQQVVDVDAEFLGVAGIERVLGVDKGGQAARRLRLGDDLQGDGGLAGGLGAEDLGDAAAGNAAHAESRVEADGAGGDDGDGQQRLVRPEPDDRPFSKLFFDLCKGKFYGFGAVIDDRHGAVSSSALSSICRGRNGRRENQKAWNAFRSDCSSMEQSKDRKKAKKRRYYPDALWRLSHSNWK